ncbi:histidine kinase [Streptosporangium violaceochromogenes]|nr:histidine kinase [Streptosporangium violaceochromogenes]
MVSLLIGTILRTKGSEVTTVHPEATVTELLAVLAARNIGVAVVSEDGLSIIGIVSERDVARRLHEDGAGVLGAPVSSIMTAEVRTCAPGANAEELRRTMTTHHIRHVPVVDGGRLVGIVSLGDVVKSTIELLESERAHLVDYLHR